MSAIAILESRIQALETELAKWKKEPKRTEIFRNGYVELHDWMGDDLRIVNMARQSFGKESATLGKKEKGLINFLARDRHGTPFEGPVFMFNVKCPIFVAREWMRHRIGSFNEYSGRYTKMMSDVYIPELEQMRTQEGKPGSYEFEALPEEEAGSAREVMQVSARRQWADYETLLGRGVAKEVARMVLPVNIYTQFTWVVNLRALMNFISLRSHKTAMYEIRQYSVAIEDQIKLVVPVAYQAFVKHGRNSP